MSSYPEEDVKLEKHLSLTKSNGNGLFRNFINVLQGILNAAAGVDKPAIEV